MFCVPKVLYKLSRIEPKLKSYFSPLSDLETVPKNSIVLNPLIAKYQFHPLKPRRTIVKAKSKITIKLINEPFYL